MNEETTPASRTRLARHTIWNLVGMCAPMLIALVSIPYLIHGLGKERFGLLALIWMVVGYFGVFDLGLGRALTKLIAERLGRRQNEVAPTFWTAMTLMLGLGLLACALAYAAAPWLATRALDVAPDLQPETLRSFRAVAFGLPVLITVNGLVGSLEACGRFPLINLIRMPMGAFTFLGPLLVLPFSRDLFPVVLVLLAGRLLEWLLFFVSCWRVVPGVKAGWRLNLDDAPRMLSFGGWMTVSNVIQPLMVHIDRFLIGGLRTVGDVAYYATSAEIVIKLLIFPRAWVSVLFPAFATALQDRPAVASALFGQSMRMLLASMFPVVFAIVAYAPEGLHFWLGSEFGEQSAPVMRWLAAGIFLYSLAFVPTSLLQSVGRPDLTAKLHAIELPLYLVAASSLIALYGIEGAAAAWVLRAAIDLAGTAWMAARRAPGSGASLRKVGAAAGFALGCFALISIIDGLAQKTVALALLTAGFGVGIWTLLFTPEDRRIVLKRLHRLPASKSR